MNDVEDDEDDDADEDDDDDDDDDDSPKRKGVTTHVCCLGGGGEGKVGIVPKDGHRPRGWASAPRTPTPGEPAWGRHPQFTNSEHACPTHYPIGGLGGKSMAGVCKRHASYTPSKT